MVLSVDFSGRSLHMVEAELRAGKLSVRRFATAKLTPECAKNGIVIDENVFIPEMASALQQAGFKSKELWVTVGGQLVTMKVMSVPNVRPKQMREVLRNEIEQFSGAEGRTRGAENLVDYMTLGEDEEHPGMLKVMAVMLPETLAAGWVNIAARLGRRPAVLDVNFNSIQRAIKLDPELVECPSGIIAALDEGGVNLNVFEKDSYIFYRNVPVARREIAEKNEFILSSFGREESGADDALFSAASDGISKMIQFQSIRARGNPVQRIYACGERAGDFALLARLEESVHVPVSVIKKPEGVKCPAGMEYYKYFCAIGAVAR